MPAVQILLPIFLLIEKAFMHVMEAILVMWQNELMQLLGLSHLTKRSVLYAPQGKSH